MTEFYVGPTNNKGAGRRDGIEKKKGDNGIEADGN